MSLQLTYGVMFVSFMGAAHFGFAVAEYERKNAIIENAKRRRLLQMLWGIIPPMCAWGCLHLSPHFAFMSLMTATTAIFMADVYFARAGMVPMWWLKLRYRSTMAALLFLGISFWIVQEDRQY
jgi:hypothetical protein